ncbi:sporulation histidine kinase inhibitor Sda [Domibacillus indicus]|nr:sporulation histidine kinase inhibitor Sda [Domibacillus indicus]MCM3790069.1 sporulation histidine kinase inhibitor Sda [Domibacillus indicus]
MRNSHLSDDQLLEAYNQAIKLNLDKEFSNMLEEEIERRKLFNNAKTP